MEKTNEPVGWIGYQEDRLVSFLQNFQQVNQFLDATNPTGKVIPLYTHPVKELDEQFEKGFKAGKEEGWKAHKFHHPAKEQDTDCQYCKQGCIRCDARKQLTDEEIRHIQAQCHLKNVGYDNFIMRFARAILRKAQEK